MTSYLLLSFLTSRCESLFKFFFFLALIAIAVNSNFKCFMKGHGQTMLHSLKQSHLQIYNKHHDKSLKILTLPCSTKKIFGYARMCYR